MSIILSRKGEILQAPVLTQEQKDWAWEILTRGWAKSNHDVLKQLQETCSKAAQPQMQ